MHDPSDITTPPSAVGQAASLPVPAICDAQANRSYGLAERRRRRWSWRLSGWLHGAIVGVIAAEFLAGIPLSPLAKEPQRGGQIEVTAVIAPPPPPLAIIAMLEDKRWTAAQIIAEEIARQTQDSAPELVGEILDTSAVPSPAATAWVQQRMLDEIATAGQLDTKDQQQRLAELGDQLEQISSVESVDAVTARLTGVLGAGGRASQPASQPVAGDFDFDTAQLHDVKRSEKAGGGYDYVAIMLDAEGRTMETSLAETEGEQLYRTFEIMKANPLLERIYRGVVMSLLDKVTRPVAIPPVPRSTPNDVR